MPIEARRPRVDESLMLSSERCLTAYKSVPYDCCCITCLLVVVPDALRWKRATCNLCLSCTSTIQVKLAKVLVLDASFVRLMAGSGVERVGPRHPGRGTPGREAPTRHATRRQALEQRQRKDRESRVRAIGISKKVACSRCDWLCVYACVCLLLPHHVILQRTSSYTPRSKHYGSGMDIGRTGGVQEAWR